MVISRERLLDARWRGRERGRRNASSPGSCPRRPRRRPGCRCRGCGCSRRWRSPSTSALRTSLAMRLRRNSSSFSARLHLQAADRLRRPGSACCGLMRSVRRTARASLSASRRGALALPMLLPLRLLVGGVAGEGPGRRELAELHADHVFRHGAPGRASGRCGRRRSGRRTAA